MPLLDTLVANVRPALLVLQAAVLLVLLVACANVANLFLVRAAGRRTEVAIRASIGAGRARLVRQFLTESLLLAVIGGAAGLLLATWGVRGLLALDPTALPRAGSVGLAPSVFAFTAAVALIAGLVFGAVPAVQLARTDLQTTLGKAGARPGAAGGCAARWWWPRWRWRWSSRPARACSSAASTTCSTWTRATTPTAC